MAREVLYRRSFHLERDLRGMENLLELDRAAVARKISAGMRISTVDCGFEAPRNSLDVPFSGLLEMRRNSEVRSEEIPIGYELSRSLTTRRRDEQYSNFKPQTSTSDQVHLKINCDVAKMNSELDPKFRAPSVVARLMGLDALPHQENLLSSNQSLVRRVLPHECMASYNVPAFNLGSVPSLASEREMSVEDPRKENLDNGELSFRNHPQEKQLQEFKREFTARQALQGRQSLPCTNVEGYTLQQKEDELYGLESQMDSQEFLDALDFLNANKEFFVKVLKDPQSSFAKHLQQGGGAVPSIEDGPRQMGGKHIKSSFTDDSAEWMKKQDMRQRSFTEKTRVMSGSRWGRDEEMPGRPRSCARGGSTLSGGRTGLDQVVPTRIVVLKPNLSKQANRRPSNPSSPVRLDGIFKSRTEGRDNVKQDVKERMQLRNDIGVARELFRDDLDKDGSKDARVIAKQIVKHVKEDMSQRLFKVGPRTVDLRPVDSLAPMGYSTGRKAGPAQRVGGLPGDVSGIRDGEGYYRTSKENGKICLSLPSSPRPSRIDSNSERWQFGFNGRRGSPTDEIKRSPHKHVTSSTKSSRESSKVEGSQGGHDSCVKQNCTRDLKGLRKTCRSTSLKVREPKCEAPRVLPRSLSAPAAASVENRALESGLKGGAIVERASCISKARPAENSLFKGRLLSLKDSFSLTKKRGSKKLTPPPLDSSDFSTPRQLGAEQVNDLSVDGNALCDSLPGVDWQAASSTKYEEAKEVTEKSVDEMLSDNSPTPSGLHQWTSMADLVDSASETSLDKCEQPSPVSVLEAPFQEESPSLVDTDSKCHELRCGLSRHLESEYKELPRNLQAAFFSQPSSRHSSFDSSADELLNAWNLPEAHLETFGLCDATCTFGSAEELAYIMHVLSLSGLNMNGLIMAHSLSSEHGLNPSIFGRLEAYYAKRGTSAGGDNGQTPLDVSSRRLLFDVVGEVVASTLKKRLLQPWTKSIEQKVLLCTGKQLLEQIFAHIRHHRFVPSETEEEVLEDMASKDLMREAPWMPTQRDIQSVVTDLERFLCGDLIREMVHECVRR
eukprot:c18858_g2_i1 orf=405-3590(+)